MSIGTEPMGPISESEITISETSLDVFGHINNAEYLRLYEQARWTIIAEKGFGIPQILAQQIGPTILEVNLTFKKEIRAREKIRIRTFVTNHQGKITRLRQVMVKENGDEASTADFVIALFDLKARRLIEPTPEWRHAIGLP